MIYSLPNLVLENKDLNELASQYAAQFGHDTTFLINRITNAEIWDSEPQQFLDLRLINMLRFESVAKDEFNYLEETYLSRPLQAASAAAGATYPATQTFAVSNLSEASTDVIYVYPNNDKGVITAINAATSEITVTPMVGMSVPAVAVGTLLSNMTSVDKNRADGFPVYFRSDYINRFNFIQTFAYAVTFTKKERWHWEKAGVVADYMARQRRNMMKFMRTKISNTIWLSERGEVVLSDGAKEKTTGGIHATMLASGSPNVTTTVSNLRYAFESIVEASEYQDYGHVRYAFMTPTLHRILSAQYKDTFIRYEPGYDDVVKLNLRMIDQGSSKIVLVPYARFNDRGSFPPAFSNRIYIIDPSHLGVKQLWGEMQGETLDRSGGVAKSYSDQWVESQLGLCFYNPLAFARIDVLI